MKSAHSCASFPCHFLWDFLVRCQQNELLKTLPGKFLAKQTSFPKKAQNKIYTHYYLRGVHQLVLQYVLIQQTNWVKNHATLNKAK